MKILTKKKQVEIGKRLAAIYYISTHGFGKGVESNLDATAKIIEHVADIAFSVGGPHMMEIDVPSGVMQLERHAAKTQREVE